MFRLNVLAATFVLAALALILPVYAAGEKSDSKIKAKAKASKIGADGKQTVTITIDIDKDWYIYANPVKAEDFEDNKTRVSFKAKEKLDKVDVFYPTGKEKALGKIKMNIYEKSVTIDAVVKRAPGDTSPLQVSIDVNSCSQKGICLLPGTVKLTAAP